jgi:hypothetical protein
MTLNGPCLTISMLLCYLLLFGTIWVPALASKDSNIAGVLGNHTKVYIINTVRSIACDLLFNSFLIGYAGEK